MLTSNGLHLIFLVAGSLVVVEWIPVYSDINS